MNTIRRKTVAAVLGLLILAGPAIAGNEHPVQSHQSIRDAAQRHALGEAEKLPSRSSPAYGQPFAEIFAAVEGDFYKIDPMLFSPARVTVSNLDTGQSFHGGALAPEIVDASFRS